MPGRPESAALSNPPSQSSSYGKGARLTYGEYLKIPELLELQQCQSDPPAHDELQFIVVHQVYELWFKLVMHELDEVMRLLDVGTDPEVHAAIRLCRRIQRILEVLVKQIHVLESMRPHDFMAFRNHLKPASGFQSVQFREFECALGLKDGKLAAFASNDARYPELLKRLELPSLSDGLYALLRARGFDVVAPGEGRSPADADRSLAALKRIYDRPDDEWLLYELCESAVDIDEQVVLWRRHHVMMVERQIGDKPGTGVGTTGDLDGIRYLKTTLYRRAFPDLWNVRSVMDDA